MNKRTLRALLALSLALCLLAGCASKSNTTVTIVTNPEATEYDESAYRAAGYYNPEDQSTAIGEVMPAPVDITDWVSAAPDKQEQVESTSGSMTEGDMTVGVVVGTEAVINPLKCTYRDLYSVNALVFESLVELDEQMQPVPLLADRWTVSGKDWTFTIRSGIKFHNGLELTAQDVLASYQEILNNPSTYWYELVSQIETMQVVDSQTLRVRSSGPAYMLLYSMTFPVVQQGTIDYALPMGTGPYWYINYVADTALRLERNPLWWKRPSDAVESVVAICYKTTKAALVGLELGEIDALATEYPTASLSRSLTDRMTLDYSTQTYECIVPNLRNNILSDISVREALMYAIDRQSLGNNIYAGMVQESEVPVTPGSWIYDPQAARFNYSPERALQLLYDAGWADANSDGVLEKTINGKERILSLDLITYDRGITSTRSEAAAIIAKQLAIVGIQVNVQVTSASEVQSAMDNGKFDLALCAFELSAMPNLAFLLGSTGKFNYSRYASDAMDSALRDAYYATTDDELRDAMSAVQMQVVADLPILGLFFRAGVLISLKSLGGLTGVRQYDVLRGLATATPVQ